MKDYKVEDDSDIIESMIAIDGEGKTKKIHNSLNAIYYETIKITKDEVILYPIAVRKNIKRIKIDDIEYFKEEGELYREQVISGGGSGDINIAGAIIGDLIAGPAGMVLGGQRKVNDIKSETITHDSRKIVLSFFTNKDKKQRDKLLFDLGIYQFFRDNLPEKEYKIVETKREKKLLNKDNEQKDITKEKLTKLKQLYEEELISKEEYEEKKKELLSDL